MQIKIEFQLTPQDKWKYSDKEFLKESVSKIDELSKALWLDTYYLPAQLREVFYHDREHIVELLSCARSVINNYRDFACDNSRESDEINRSQYD